MPRFSIPIPAHIPEDDVCVQVSIPNSPEFIQMFYDALSRLSHTRNYARDDSKSGKLLADTWVNRTLSPLLDDLINQSGCSGMTIDCNDIEDCLETSIIINNVQSNLLTLNYASPVVQHTMNTWNYHSNTNITNNVGESVADTVEIPDLCHQSLWAGCVSIAQMLHSQNMDFLERTAAITGSNMRKITGVVDMIPILGAIADEIVIADLIDFIALMATDMYVQYEAIVTDDLIFETACGYYAIGCASCTPPTYEQIIDYHAQFLTGLNLDNSTVVLADIISIYLTGTFVSNMWFHAITWFQLWVLLAEETFLGKRGTEWINFAYRLGSNNPDADYELWCDPCGAASNLEYNFGINAQGWTNVSSASWFTGAWRSANTSAAYTIQIILGSPTDIVQLDFNYRAQWDCGGHPVTFSFYDASDALIDTVLATANGTGVTGNAWNNDVPVGLYGVKRVTLEYGTACANNARAIFFVRFETVEQ